MGHDQREGECASSNAVASKSDYEYAWKLVHRYFTMLTVGCGSENCINSHCCSNPQTQPLLATEAAIKSIYFATNTSVPLCIESVPQQFDQHQQETCTTTEAPKFVQAEKESIPESQADDEENQTEEAVPSSEDPISTKKELPETSEVDIPKIQEPESIVIRSIHAVASPRKSTPRRRLSVAKQLDNGLNKNHEQPAIRPTVVTRVVVQPRHKSVIDNDSATVDGTDVSDIPVQQQEHDEKAPNKSSAKDSRKRLVSRQKEKLFDAIRRSFSRSKKTSLV